MALGATTPSKPTWEARARDKRWRILSNVPKEFIHDELTFSETDPASVMDVPERYLSSQELTLTSLRADELVPLLASRAYTAVQVLDAFVHRAVIAHQLLHCCGTGAGGGAGRAYGKKGKACRADARPAAVGEGSMPRRAHGDDVRICGKPGEEGCGDLFVGGGAGGSGSGGVYEDKPERWVYVG